jgi:hypothetical protein
LEGCWEGVGWVVVVGNGRNCNYYCLKGWGDVNRGVRESSKVYRVVVVYRSFCDIGSVLLHQTVVGNSGVDTFRKCHCA